MAEADVALVAGFADDSRGIPALDRWLGALADADRREMIRHLAMGTIDGEATIGELAFAVGVSHYSASRHLQTLRVAGLVTSRKVGNRIMVRLVDERLRLIDDWVGSVVDSLGELRPGHLLTRGGVDGRIEA